MRPDMAKVIVERPRRKSRIMPGGAQGGYKRKLVGRQRDEDEHGLPSWPRRERIKQRYGYEARELNENLSPLYRYLDSQVGRLWNDVYSEICQHLRRDNAVQAHVFQHIFGYNGVNRYARLAPNGVAIDEACSYLSRGQRREMGDGELYVHPTTGVLSKYVKRRAVKARQPPNVIRRSPTHFHAIHDGVWYEIAYTEPQVAKDRYQEYHVLKATWELAFERWPVDMGDFERITGARIAKRQLGKRELRDCGLRR